MRSGGGTEESWQSCTVRQLREITAELPVEAVVVAGSAGERGGRIDEWSDLDVVVVAESGQSGVLWPDRTWLSALGPVCAHSQSPQPPGGVTRLVLSDGRRIDIIVTESGQAAERIEGLTSPSVAVGAGTLAGLANGILFDAAVAVCKAGRGERLVAGHLAIGLLQRCLEAAMVLRDLAWQTGHHPGPRPEDALANALPAVPPALDPAGILNLVEAALEAFAEIVSTASAPPAFPREAIDRLLGQARAAIG